MAKRKAPDFDLVHILFDERKDTFLERSLGIKKYWNYYDGKHKRHLRTEVAPNSGESVDDNVTVNLCGILIDRAVSRLFGDPHRGELLNFDIESKEEVAATKAAESEGQQQGSSSLDARELEAKRYLNEVFERSGGLDNLLFRIGEFGSVTGHYVTKLRMEEDGPRIITLDTKLVDALVAQDDKDKVRAWRFEYDMKARDPKDDKIKDVTFRQLIVDGEEFNGPPGWYMQDFIDYKRPKTPAQSTIWEPVSDLEIWEEAPIQGGQNLPDARSVWGRSDMLNVTELNDEINFLLSNTNRIIRFHAHPRTVGIGVDPADIVETSIESFWSIPGDPESVNIFNLEMESDLRSVYSFYQLIREAFWVISRETDPTVFKDKIGNVTNFGLRVLFLDALNKLGQKRQSYGKSLVRMIEAVLALGGYEDLTVIPKWSDPLPADPREEIETMMLEMDMGILSRETAATERGRNWSIEKDRVEDDKEDQLQRSMMDFMRGRDPASTKPNTDKRNIEERR